MTDYPNCEVCRKPIYAEAVVTHPECAVALNHQQWLGATTQALMGIENGLNPRDVFRELWKIMDPNGRSQDEPANSGSHASWYRKL